MRRVYVGDVQGCREELEQLLEAVAFDPASDRIEPVGDLVNRGPDSLGVLRLLRSLRAGGVLGNHDVHLLRVAAGRRRPGRRDTFRDVLSAPDRDELLAWLAERPFVKSFDDVILVHAALNPTWRDPVGQLSGIDPLAWSDDSDFALRARYCTPSGERPRRDHPDPGLPFVPWYEHWAGRDSRTVVFGNVRDQSLYEIWNSPRMVAHRRRYLNHDFKGLPLCETCRVDQEREVTNV